MKNGLVWEENNQELLFLLTNQETFKKLYDKEGIEIYEFIK